MEWKTMNRKRILQFVPVLCWMGVIFYLSAQPAEESSELSTGLMHVLLQYIERIAVVDEGFFHHIIRKIAHLFAYFILGILAMFAFEKQKWHSLYQGIIAYIICVLYAMSDEIHQLFVPGRSGEIGDVGIDASGALLGILLYILLQKIFRRWRASKSII